MVGNMSRQNVTSGSPYEPIIGFSRAVRIGNTIAVGGTAPIGPDGKNAAVGDPAGQVRRSLEIIKASIEKAGGKMEDVIRTRVFFTRQHDWQAIGKAHGEFFGSIRPASSMIVVKALLDDDWLVEIEADAVIGG
jgi:enamine deaminase RidA (YjgF/YER057c/UK114 family)